MKIKIIQNYLKVCFPHKEVYRWYAIYMYHVIITGFFYKTKNIYLVFSVKLSSLVDNLYVLLNKKVNMRNLYSYRKVHKSVHILHV